MSYQEYRYYLGMLYDSQEMLHTGEIVAMKNDEEGVVFIRPQFELEFNGERATKEEANKALEEQTGIRIN